MKILNIACGFDISFNGGITNYVREISQELMNQGHEVIVIYSQDNKIKKRYSFTTIPIKTKLRPFHLADKLHNNDSKTIEKTLNKYRPDIVCVHMMLDLPLDILSIIKKYSKLVIVLHDYFYICKKIIKIDNTKKICHQSNENMKCDGCINKFESINSRYLNNRITRKLLKLIPDGYLPNTKKNREFFLVKKEFFNNADLVISVSERVKEIYNLEGFDNPNFIVNTLGSYTSDRKFTDEFLNYRRIINPPTPLKIGFIGNLIYHKGSEIFKEILIKTKHEYHVYGGIEESLLYELEKYDNFYYHGKYNHEDLVSILKQIDIGLTLSVWEECFGLVTLEYLNANIPVIGTNMGATPKVIKDRGVVFNIDEKSINAMIQYINSEEIYILYNKVIIKDVQNKTVPMHVEKLIENFRDILI